METDGTFTSPDKLPGVAALRYVVGSIYGYDTSKSRRTIRAKISENVPSVPRLYDES
jgi:hypothetical protein